MPPWRHARHGLFRHETGRAGTVIGTLLHPHEDARTDTTCCHVPVRYARQPEDEGRPAFVVEEFSAACATEKMFSAHVPPGGDRYGTQRKISSGLQRPPPVGARGGLSLCGLSSPGAPPLRFCAKPVDRAGAMRLSLGSEHGTGRRCGGTGKRASLWSMHIQRLQGVRLCKERPLQKRLTRSKHRRG